ITVPMAVLTLSGAFVTVPDVVILINFDFLIAGLFIQYNYNTHVELFFLCNKLSAFISILLH
ncbi:hypothetical protein, partial [Providencia alcalifaciens]|uniref:hypothetical protein n=1 Tax=Providencia alcalifaciens TaxID=126385 RepID=UPI002B0578F7